MKSKEEFLEDKIIAITEQVTHIRRCIYMIKRISKYPKPKSIKTYLRRGVRIFGYAASIRSSLVHIDIIMAQTQSVGLPTVGNLFED